MKSIRDFSEKKEEPTSVVPTSSDKYAGMDKNELMNELTASVAAAKADGSFSAATLDEFVAFVSPSLAEQSRKRLEELVAVIKSQA